MSRLNRLDERVSDLETKVSDLMSNELGINLSANNRQSNNRQPRQPRQSREPNITLPTEQTLPNSSNRSRLVRPPSSRPDKMEIGDAEELDILDEETDMENPNVTRRANMDEENDEELDASITNKLEENGVEVEDEDEDEDKFDDIEGFRNKEAFMGSFSISNNTRNMLKVVLIVLLICLLNDNQVRKVIKNYSCMVGLNENMGLFLLLVVLLYVVIAML